MRKRDLELGNARIEMNVKRQHRGRRSVRIDSGLRIDPTLLDGGHPVDVSHQIPGKCRQQGLIRFVAWLHLLGFGDFQLQLERRWLVGVCQATAATLRPRSSGRRNTVYQGREHPIPHLRRTARESRRSDSQYDSNDERRTEYQARRAVSFTLLALRTWCYLSWHFKQR